MLPDTFHNGMEEKKNGSFVFTDPPSLKWVFPACKFEDWGGLAAIYDTGCSVSEPKPCSAIDNRTFTSFCPNP